MLDVYLVNIDTFNWWTGSKKEKLLGVTIDKDLKFNKHISNICMKASRKLTALGRLRIL